MNKKLMKKNVEKMHRTETATATFATLTLSNCFSEHMFVSDGTHTRNDRTCRRQKKKTRNDPIG